MAVVKFKAMELKSRAVLCVLMGFLVAPAVADPEPKAVIVQANALSSSIEEVEFFKGNFPSVSEFYGANVILQDDLMIVSSGNEGSATRGINGDESDNSAPQSGAVWVYIRQGDEWVQEAYIKSSNSDGGDVFGNPGDSFGTSISLHGDTLVVGAPFERSISQGVNGNQGDNTIVNAGAAYVFVRNNGSWSQQAYLKASNSPQVFPNLNTFFFGAAVAIHGDIVAVGAPLEDSLSRGINGSQSYETALTANDNTQVGAVYVFVRNGNNWSQQAYLKSSNADPGGPAGNGAGQVGDQFGGVLDLDGDTLVVGVPNEFSSATGVNGDQNNNDVGFSGAVYAFVRNGSSWSQQAYIKPSNTGSADVFGSSLDLDGDRLVVGAPQEKSNSTGINGDQDNNTVGFAGAAYLFERDGGTWVQTQYFKPSNTDFNDRFGTSVSLNGNRLAVGANGESSAATGVDGDQLDNSALGAGATYLFEETQGIWNQMAYIKASNAEAGDAFGADVFLLGDTLAVGATGVDGGSGGIGADPLDNSVLSTGAVFLFNVNDAVSFSINAGINDAWVSEQAPLQGLFITVFENLGLVFLSWFTFDSTPPASPFSAIFGADDQRWLTASGGFSGNTATLKAELTTGGVFNAADPLASQDTGYGDITIVFNSCNEAILTYDFPGVSLSGQMTLERVLDSNVALCESLQVP